MSSFPRVEICGSGVNFYCIWKGCLAVSQHLILLILLRIQHSERPWTRAEFYCLSHPKKIFSPLVIATVWSRTVFYRLEYLNACLLVGITVFGKCEAIAGGACLAELVTMGGPLKIQPKPGSPLVLGFQAQRPPEASPHSPAASSQASPSATSSSPGWTVFLKAGARGNPSFHKVFVHQALGCSHEKSSECSY